MYLDVGVLQRESPAEHGLPTCRFCEICEVRFVLVRRSDYVRVEKARETPASPGPSLAGRSIVKHQSSSAPRLMERVRRAIRPRHYSRRTEEAYAGWIRRYIKFHGMRHPEALGPDHISSFLSPLATEGHVSASTQSQALCAVLFLYRVVLGRNVDVTDGVVRAHAIKRLPVVLTRTEVAAVFERLEGAAQLVVGPLYGGGLRLREAPELRVKDLDLNMGR